MKCHEAKHRLDLFMDGELSVPENLQVLEHLNLCRACASLYEGEKSLRASLKTHLGAETAPASIYAKLSEVAKPSRVSSNLPPRPSSAHPLSGMAGASEGRRWGALAAAVFFVTLAATLLFTPGVETPRALAAEVAEKHDAFRRGFCGESRSDCLCLCEKCRPAGADPVGAFFRKHVTYDVCAHDLKGMGYSVVGATIRDHRGEKVCWTVQQDGKGHTITHALFAAPLAMDRSAGPLAIRSKDHPILFVPSAPGMTCVFIFDSEAEAERFRGLMGGRK